MNQIAMSAVIPNHLSQLLQRPICRRVVRHAYVRKPAPAVFDDDEDVQQSESGRDGDK
jgi:hypothetical protein